MLKILHLKLKILAKMVLRKYKPKIIGITGSVGKTSAKEAIFCVLDGKFSVRRSRKNYNNEIGTPMTILGYISSPGKNIFLWFWRFLQAGRLIIFRDKNYPQVLILEMGADHPGDIQYLTSIAKPSVGVITAIGASHLEFFKTIENIVKEKSKILRHLGSEGWAVINNDDHYLEDAIYSTKAHKKTFGASEGSDVRITDVKITKKDDKYGTSFKLVHQGAEVPMFLPNVLGRQHAQAAATAAAVGLAMGMNLVEIGEKLLNYKPARGRTNLIEGVKNTWLIDDSYNASPQSSKLAIDILADIPIDGRKIAVFGDMLELGSLSEEGHREVGRELVRQKIDYLFVVGERSRDIARGAKEAGMDEDKIYHFPYSEETGIFLQERMKEGDVVLVKGSRGVKMEQVVYEIMARPWLADELLVAKVVK